MPAGASALGAAATARARDGRPEQSYRLWTGDLRPAPLPPRVPISLAAMQDLLAFVGSRRRGDHRRGANLAGRWRVHRPVERMARGSNCRGVRGTIRILVSASQPMRTKKERVPWLAAARVAAPRRAAPGLTQSSAAAPLPRRPPTPAGGASTAKTGWGLTGDVGGRAGSNVVTGHRVVGGCVVESIWVRWEWPGSDVSQSLARYASLSACS